MDKAKWFIYGAGAYLLGQQIQKMAFVQAQLSKNPAGFLSKNAGPIAAGLALLVAAEFGVTSAVAKAV